MNNPVLPVERPPEVFNSPLECGLRSTVLLVECFPAHLDIQRLVQYDYLLVHSGDAGGPPSLHPATPHRSGELLIKRPLIEAGVRMMMQKSIIECTFSAEGILYCAGNWSLTFLGAIQEPYLASLRSRAKWISHTFGSMSNARLSAFVSEHWTAWGAEFELQAFVQGGEE